MTGMPQSVTGAPRRPNLLRFLLAALFALCIVVIFSLWLGHHYLANEVLRGDMRAAFNRSSEADSVIVYMADAESSQRGYVLSGDIGYLAGYEPARAAAVAALDRLRAVSADAAVETVALDKMRVLALRKFAEMDLVIKDRKEHGLGSAAALVRKGLGEGLMRRMRQVSPVVVESSRQTREARSRRFSRHLYQDSVWIGVGVWVVGGLTIIAAIAVWWQRLAEYRVQLEACNAAERNRAILQSTVDGIATLDSNGIFETVNTAVTRMLGYRADELVGRDVTMVIKLLDPLISFRQCIGLVDGHIAQPYMPDRNIIHRDGHKLPVDIALGIMRLPDGDHVVVSVHDISERKRADRRKDELISTVSHELRTPLTSVVGALGLLQSGAAGTIDAGPARLIEIAENNSRRLIRLINDMLDIDRIQSGSENLAKQLTDLRDVVRRACEGSQGEAGAANVTIDCTVPTARVAVLGDADRLLQVISNLASNAIRVSDAGQTIYIGVTTTEQDKAVVTVDDDGAGIPAEFRDRMFGRFERAEGEHGGGTGLGLAISREIIDRHGGRIWFEDRRGGGTRFAFSLDLLEPGRVVTNAASGARLLICEGDRDVAETLGRMVEGMGFAADRVRTIAAARKALPGAGYWIMLLASKLSDGSGLSLVRSLRASNGALPLPIIIISAQPRDRQRVPIPNDIVDWIKKPVDAERLAFALSAVTKGGRAAA